MTPVERKYDGNSGFMTIGQGGKYPDLQSARYAEPNNTKFLFVSNIEVTGWDDATMFSSPGNTVPTLNQDGTINIHFAPVSNPGIPAEFLKPGIDMVLIG